MMLGQRRRQRPNIISINSKVNNSELIHPNYCVYRRERHATFGDTIGGAVALCVNNNISSCRRHDLEPQEEIVLQLITIYM